MTSIASNHPNLPSPELSSNNPTSYPAKHIRSSRHLTGINPHQQHSRPPSARINLLVDFLPSNRTRREIKRTSSRFAPKRPLANFIRTTSEQAQELPENQPSGNCGKTCTQYTMSEVKAEAHSPRVSKPISIGKWKKNNRYPSNRNHHPVSSFFFEKRA